MGKERELARWAFLVARTHRRPAHAGGSLAGAAVPPRSTHEHAHAPPAVAEKFKKPSLDEARGLPRHASQLANETLSLMAVYGSYKANRERLLREIMRVDDASWTEAHRTLHKMNADNDKFRSVALLPYRLGLASGLVFGFGCVPLVFHREAAMWFNERYVHEDLPPNGVQDLETVYQVGTWTWAWMEPLIGTASFVLLAMHFCRSQLLNMQLKPYSERLVEWRARRLVRMYPQYDQDIVRAFSRSDSWFK